MTPRIKKTYICRQVDKWSLQPEINPGYVPQVGDVGIFEVLYIGKHDKIQSDSKRNVTIIEGDLFMAAFGSRYATAQFEGYVPEHVNQELHILGIGGTIGVLKSMHFDLEDIGPTKLRMVGLAIDQNSKVINTKSIMCQEMIPFSGAAATSTKVILSLGSSMDSGKTTSAAYLTHGLKKVGLKIAYVKLTGTVYTKDCDLAWDLGADFTADFGDYGFPSTYLCEEQELLSLYESLLARTLPHQPDYVIMEIADGLYQRETRMLLNNNQFTSTIECFIFSAGDSLAAISGLQLLNKSGIYPLFVSGLLTASPLLIKEVEENTHVPVFNIEELADGKKVIALLKKSPALVSKQ